MSVISSHALRYADLGWHVIWAPPGSKHPTMKGWPDIATTDAGIIWRWWTEHPNANVCVVTGPESGIFVLDVDDKPGKVGSATLADLERRYGNLPDTYTVGTGSGGVHHYFSYEGVDFELKNSAGKLGPDLDVRGTGGQVVAPPSRVAEQHHAMPYTVLTDVPAVPAPKWLLDLLRPEVKRPFAPPQRAEVFSRPTVGGGGGYTNAAVQAELDRIRTAPNGQGNQILASAVYNIATLAAADWSDVKPEQAYQAAVAAIDGWHFETGDDYKRMQNTINKQFEYE
ncbi:bifunctional DNA primase/polymerase [Streptomyces sp. NPDC048564]|uniref:bifunctional DNA primase/polymerase n=1 Tax=Streptomyces sp. NPDC048564 TaxID=3155760 RepID=UPI00342C0B9F